MSVRVSVEEPGDSVTRLIREVSQEVGPALGPEFATLGQFSRLVRAILEA